MSDEEIKQAALKMKALDLIIATLSALQKIRPAGILTEEKKTAIIDGLTAVQDQVAETITLDEHINLLAEMEKAKKQWASN